MKKKFLLALGLMISLVPAVFAQDAAPAASVAPTAAAAAQPIDPGALVMARNLYINFTGAMAAYRGTSGERVPTEDDMLKLEIGKVSHICAGSIVAANPGKQDIAQSLCASALDRTYPSREQAFIDAKVALIAQSFTLPELKKLNDALVNHDQTGAEALFDKYKTLSGAFQKLTVSWAFDTLHAAFPLIADEVKQNVLSPPVSLDVLKEPQ
ncbi:MAG: hypothetical protein P4M15_09650 [Alphaproteobacteria bacterium]|nr:hypothetical protein [Alphaproteobacteria bacterium]